MTAPSGTTAPETAPTAPVVVEPVVPVEDVSTLPVWARDAITKANREAASYRTKVAELQPRADQFAALEEASKTEAQRLADAAASATKDAADARAEAIRYKAAATHKIGAEHFDLLGQGTEEEVTARAEKLAGLLAAQVAPATTPVTPTVRPVEQLRSGATPSGTESEDDVVYSKLFGPQK